MRLAFVVVLILLAGCSSSEPTTDVEENTPAAKPSAATGSIVGVVVDETISPLVDVTVKAGEQETTTDERGAFVFNGLAPGALTVTTAPAGHLPMAADIIIVSGEILELRIVASTDRRTTGFHQTLTFDGRMDTYLGPAGLVLETAQPGATGCTCTFDLDVADDARTFIVEAFGQSSPQSNPMGDDLFWELIAHDNPGTPDDENFTVSGTGSYPLYASVPASIFEGAVLEHQVRLTGAAWIHIQETYELFVTIFYVDQAPDGWSIDD